MVTVLGLLALGFTGQAQALPSGAGSAAAGPEIALPGCPAPPAGQMVSSPQYDQAYEWRRSGRLRRVQLSRTVVKDAYATLTLDYGLSEQLLKVEETFDGEAGRTGRVWWLRGGQVIVRWSSGGQGRKLH